MSIENIKAEVAGTVSEVLAKVGDRVASGEAVLVLESMKMEIPIETAIGGHVTELCVAPGDVVAQGQLLARIES